MRWIVYNHQHVFVCNREKMCYMKKGVLFPALFNEGDGRYVEE